MSELIIENIKAWNESLSNGSFILLQHTDQIPPHISLLQEGNYYSASALGVKANMPFQSVFKNIDSKKIPCLILEIKPLRYSPEAIAEVFHRYGPLNQEGKSCLFPVIEILNQSYGLIHESEFVFELIRELKKNGNLLNIYQLHMENKLDKDSFLFPVYSRQDINFCISRLIENP